ncbi:MAG: hypothetical protein ACK4PI_08635 [Tepidisphaerales bacterium]
MSTASLPGGGSGGAAGTPRTQGPVGGPSASGASAVGDRASGGSVAGGPVGGGSTWAGAVRGLLGNRAYVVTATILLLAAVGLHGATQRLQLHFRKQAVPLRADVRSLPERMGPWVQVSIDQPLSPDIEEVLGTSEYIFRNYVDSRRVSESEIAAFRDLNINERAVLLSRIAMRDPQAVMYLSFTYYTGMVDTVAHIPDRCFIADGFQPTRFDAPRWHIPGFVIDRDGYHVGPDGYRLTEPGERGGDDAGLPVRFINFEDQDLRTRTASSRSVTYFFSVNGRYEANPIGVRKTLQNLFERYGYYAKVELMTLHRDPEVSAAMKRDFLEHALPELEKILPDWAAVREAERAGVKVSASRPTAAERAVSGARAER